MSDDTKKVVRNILAWIVGAAALFGFWLLLKSAGPSHSQWAPVYLAGAAGGLCFELIRNRWRLELPSANHGVGRRPESSFAPFGPLLDLAFLGRMFTGAVAAPTFLGIVNALNAPAGQSVTSYLSGVAGRSETIAWGVGVGFAAPAVWSMIEGFVKARGAAADAQLQVQHNQATLIEQKAEELIASGNGTSAQGLAEIKALAQASKIGATNAG